MGCRGNVVNFENQQITPHNARLAFDYKNPADVRKALSRVLWHVALCTHKF